MGISRIFALMGALGLAWFAATYQIRDPAPVRLTAAAPPPTLALSTDAIGRHASLRVSPNPVVLRSGGGESAESSVSVVVRGASGYLQVTSQGVLQPIPDIASAGNRSFNVVLRSVAGLVAGPHYGVATFRMCRETPCVNVIAGTEVLVPYRVLVDWVQVGDWETFQRDARHAGHVPVTLQPERFAFKWQWQRTTPGTLRFINSVVTEAGRVFVSDDEYFGSPMLRALDEHDGSLLWEQVFPQAPALNPPAVSDGKVYVATTGHEKTALWAFASADGAPVMQVGFAGQWPHVLAPTVKDGRVYTNGGYYGGGVYAFDATLGDPLWSRFAGDDDMTTPAVDDEHVYYYSGTGLNVYAAATGASVASIADPYFPGQGYSYHAAPILGSADHVIAFSGGAFSGRASSSVEQYESRWLVNYSPAGYSVRWRTARTYITQPAIAKGVVYAGSQSPKSFDAINEATGQVLWSWVPGTADTEFHRNVVVTDNLVFVSTNRAVYAIDLTTHQPVWSYPVPGMIAISGSGTLYIVEGAREPTGRLIAINLRIPMP